MQKTFENPQKSLPKWRPKPSKNLQLDAKKESIFRSSARKPGRPAGSGKWNKKATETYRKTNRGRQPAGEEFREEHAERPT